MHPDQLWTGGRTDIFSPYLAKSENSGQAWTLLNGNISTGTDGTVFDAIVASERADHVLVSMNGRMRSTDGGVSWERLEAGNFFSLAFVHSAREPGIVYSSGLNPEQTVFFAASGDFGDTWQIAAHEDGPAGIEVNHLAAATAGNTELLYLGTNKGVFSFTFEE